MDSLFQTGLNFCFPSGLLTCTGAETVYDTTVAITSCINGKLTPRAAVTDGATPTTDAVTGAAFRPLTANRGCVIVWALEGSTVRCMQGPIEVLDGGVFQIAPKFPNVPDTMAPFAYQVLKAGATAGTITFGSSNWNATGFTNVIQNVAVLPDRPQVA
jgi:hypothetical protein